MKKLLFYLLIFTLFAAAAGCSSGKDDDGNPDVRFYAVPASLNFEAGKTTLQLSISTTGHWTIVCDDEWLEAVPAEGTGSAKVGITAQANPLAQQRTSSLTIAYGGAEPAVVPVTQKVSGEESVDLFGSTDEMKAYLKARVEACNYAEVGDDDRRRGAEVRLQGRRDAGRSERGDSLLYGERRRLLGRPTALRRR